MPYDRYPQYVGIAHNPNTDECEWAVFGGKGGKEGAEYRVKRWCEQPGWHGFVRPCEDPILEIRPNRETS